MAFGFDSLETATAHQLYKEAMYKPGSWDNQPIDSIYYKVRDLLRGGESEMYNLNDMQEKYIIKDLKAMVRLGYMDESLRLTSDGIRFVVTALFDANRELIAKKAQAEVSKRERAEASE